MLGVMSDSINSSRHYFTLVEVPYIAQQGCLLLNLFLNVKRSCKCKKQHLNIYDSPSRN
jgi:hypothetical protein